MNHLILHNATLHNLPAAADAVAISGGVIMAVGNGADLMDMARGDTQVIDCGGRVIIPGIVEDHCHLPATAARRMQVDCRPSSTPNVAAVIAVLRGAAAMGDGWVRGYGYDDSPVGLGRHLNRHDLDAGSALRPIRVDHRSGHACVLNSSALAAVGIDRDTDDPTGSAIARDADGEPTGLLLEMGGWLREKTGEPPLAATGTFRSALEELGQELLGYGITAATDAGPYNSLARWREFMDWLNAGALPVKVTMMAGINHMVELRAAGLSYGDIACDGRLTLGHAKIMLTATSGQLNPHPDELAEMITMAHGRGFPVAIHAVERDAVVAAAMVLSDHPAPVDYDRIEHCAECPPDVAELVAESGARVVTNTGFLHYDGERYRRTVSAELLPHLYPAGALADRGVPVALGSDAPVVEPNPWASMAAAITRRTAEGNILGGPGVPSVQAALAMHTGGNRITPGLPADLAVVEPNPFTLPPDDLPSVRALATIVAGRVVYQRDRSRM